MSSMNGDELDLVRWLSATAVRRSNTEQGIGDDMAVLKGLSSPILVAADMLLDGVHFQSEEHAPRDIGRKALACNLSDCAAMAVRPVAACVSIALSPRQSTQCAQDIMAGAIDLGERFGVDIVGGDTNRWPHPLVIDVSIVAEAFPGIRPVLRRGARPGDSLYVTGPLGGSLSGKHLTFEPRVGEAERLARGLGDRLHAMMDISDGLSLDLWRLCDASGVGAELRSQWLQPILSDSAVAMSRQDDRTPLDHALHDGEDFELLFASEGDAGTCGVDVWRIGTVTESGLHLWNDQGKREPLVPKGWVH